ncbi:MAG: efflux RND transporter periplasmic adaptor subunit [Chloroflexota bacterium]|nr:efflux RND transporter periplasmic adaptor subunit [Chloroflexota bacterium]
MRRLIFVPLLIIVAVLAIGGGIGYWVWDNYTFYRTDDAQVTGKIANISAPAAGTLDTFNVKVGDTVTAGQAIGTLTPTQGGAAGSINITSPINGTIIAAPGVQGQGVTPGLAIAQVTDLRALNVTAYVDENALNNIQNGQSVDISIDAYNGTSFSGHVQQIIQATASQFSLIPTTDYASGNFTKVGQRVPVIVTLDGTGGKDIVPGMSASVTIHLH